MRLLASLPKRQVRRKFRGRSEGADNRRFSSYLHNQLSYQKTEATVGFCASNRSRNHLERGLIVVGRPLLPSGNDDMDGHVYNYSDVTSADMAKRMAPLESLH